MASSSTCGASTLHQNLREHEASITISPSETPGPAGGQGLSEN